MARKLPQAVLSFSFIRQLMYFVFLILYGKIVMLLLQYSHIPFVVLFYGGKRDNIKYTILAIFKSTVQCI